MKKIFFTFNALLAMALVLATYAQHINPIAFGWIGFLGLAFPFLLCLNIISLCFFFLFFRRKSLYIVTLIALLLSWKNIGAFFTISAANRSTTEISIMSWNVKNFDLYNWSKNEATHELMMQLLEKEKPDVLCLQEFYTQGGKGKFKNISEIKKRLGYKYYYFHETFALSKGAQQWGLATFSKFPIKNKGNITFENKSKLNAAMFTDIAYTKDSLVRVYNVHLQSVHFGSEDYAYLDELKTERKANVNSTKKIVRKLKKGFQYRAKQALQIKEHQQKSNNRSIICGDFNDSPFSFTYATLNQNMHDSFTEKGWGFGNTWTNLSPFFRIDFILLDENIKVNQHKRLLKKHSDHYPIKVHFEM